MLADAWISAECDGFVIAVECLVIAPNARKNVGPIEPGSCHIRRELQRPADQIGALFRMTLLRSQDAEHMQRCKGAGLLIEQSAIDAFGLAKRSLAIALEYVSLRQAQGHVLAERESIRTMLGDAALQIDIGRLLTMRAAWKLDRGEFARKEISMAKVVVADVLQQAVDTALQLNGARGYSKDTVIEWIYRYARQARLVDGASEVHKMVLARFLLDERDRFWSWDVAKP